MKNEPIDFTIQEAGCLLYLADKNLGGYDISRFHEFFGGAEGLDELVLKGAVMPMSLYQDDGYYVRVRFGEITDEEQANWTSRVRWKLNLESGEMAVSGVCDEDLEDYLEEFGVAENGGYYELGCFVQIPKGEYEVNVYSYPPGDLAGGWMRIEHPHDFKLAFGGQAGLDFEKPIDYFKRTRPDETPPAWITDGYDERAFLSFLVQIKPLTAEPEPVEFEEDGCIKWEYRKPEICPVGIVLDSVSGD